jgi:hypothetical protein
MVRNYHNQWGSPLPDGFTMVAPEQTCVIPIPGTKHVCPTCWYDDGKAKFNTLVDPNDPSKPCPTCKGEGFEWHYLEGTLDGLIADQYSRVYVLERKTYGQRPKLEVLNMQDQFLAYLWILRTLGLGEVGGLAYDGAWKRKEPPRGSALNDLFLRIRLNRSPRELDNFQVQLAAQVNEMASNPAIYVNRRWDGCWDCDFVEPCVAMMRGDDYKFMLTAKYTHRPVTEDSVRELKHADAA